MSSKTSKSTNGEEKKTGVIPRSTLYSIASRYSKEAIITLYTLMKEAKQESVRMGAAKSLLDKALPDLKAMEVSGQDGEDLKLIVKIIEDKHDNGTAGN